MKHGPKKLTKAQLEQLLRAARRKNDSLLTRLAKAGLKALKERRVNSVDIWSLDSTNEILVNERNARISII